VDIERTMEFILATQAQLAAKQAADQAEQAVRAARIDRQINGITKLIKIGMRLVNRNAEQNKKTDEKTDRHTERLDAFEYKMNAVVDAQIRTEENLQQVSKRLDSTAERLDSLTARVDSIGAQVDAISERLNALAAAHQATEASLKAFIDAMTRGGNGHGPNRPPNRE
jgi:septal ring factor EnvC (AmiA/AmiB activator)